jgi:hypothetical protein
VQDVGTNTAGSSPADDNGTEVWIGIVIEGATDARDALDVAAVAGTLADADADAGAVVCVDAADEGDGEDGDKLGEGDVVGEGDAFRLPACLPTKNAPTQIPMTQANPSIDSVRLLAGVIELI